MKIDKMQSRIKRIFILSLAIATVAILNQSALSQTKENVKAFYKGAMVKFIVPYAPGGGYDMWARMLSPYLEKHTGAKMIVENMPGASGMVGGGYLYSIAKPDGLTIGILPMPGMILAEMLEFEAAKFEMSKFTYIGRLEVGWRVVYVSKASGFKTIDDMKKSPKLIRFATIDPTTETTVNGALFCEALGLNAKLIPGYKGSKEMVMATVAGRETDAVFTAITGYQDFIRKGDLIIVAVLGDKRIPEFPDAPSFAEITNVTPEGKRWLELLNILNDGQRMILGPPGMPEDKSFFLDQAVTESLKEPEFIKQAQANDFLISPLPGKDCKALIDRLTEIVPKADRPNLKRIITQKYF